MKLPIAYLAQELGQYLETTNIQEEAVDYLVERPRFLTDEKVLRKGGLYLVEEEELTGRRIENGAFLIGRSEGYHILCLQREANILKVSNRLHQLFDQAEDWFMRMKKCGEANGTLEQLLAVAGEYLPCYMAIMDPDFRILCCYGGDAQTQEDIHGDSGYLKIDIVNALRQDICYDAVEDYQGAFLYAGRELKSRFLCVNLLDGGVCLGRINLRENPETPFCPWHGFFLERVRDALLPVYLRQSRTQEHFRRRREFVQLLLEGEKNVQDELYWFLEDIGWKEQGHYVCGCIRMEQMEERRDAAAYYARELAYLAEDTVCVPVEQRIYFLRTISQEKEREGSFWEKMNYFIRESNFRLGMSREYSDIRQTSFARRQAQIALDFGQRQLAHQWKYQFDDVVLAYLSGCMLRELPAGQVCHPVFSMLLADSRPEGHKQAGEVDLYQTLVAFIRQDFNMVQTAKELFIHRGTLIYRLNRIRELTGVSWEGWQEKMYLALSVMLLEETGK